MVFTKEASRTKPLAQCVPLGLIAPPVPETTSSILVNKEASALREEPMSYAQAATSMISCTERASLTASFAGLTGIVITEKT